MNDRSNDETQPIPVAGKGADLPERPYAARYRMEAVGMTHRGRVRETNQDHFLVARMGRSLRTLSTSLPSGEVPRRFDETGYVLMVADGMGGAAGGEIASRKAISTLVNIVLDVPEWIMKADASSVSRLVRRAEQYYRKLHEEISDLAREDPGLHGMGTTMTVAYCIGDILFVAHVGDSRAYVHHAGGLRQLTRDHTHVQHLVETGEITREEAASHHLRHVLTNVIGGSVPGGRVEIQRMPLHDGDRILLCSDGLTEVVRDHEIAEILSRDVPSEFLCRTLIDLALERGAPDNVTVVSGRFRDTRPQSDESHDVGRDEDTTDPDTLPDTEPTDPL